MNRKQIEIGNGARKRIERRKAKRGGALDPELTKRAVENARTRSTRETLTATFEIVTPAFVGGKDSYRAELRLSGILGPLRFWWRALAWPRACARKETEAERLELIADWENSLFGSAAKTDGNDGPNGGQGLWDIRLVENQTSVKPIKGRQPQGLAYLLGQGLCRNKQLTRQPLRPGGSFTLNCTTRAGTISKDAPSLREAIRMFGLLGSIGARSRRGFGSVTLVSMVATGTPPYVRPNSLEEYARSVSKLFHIEHKKCTVWKNTPYTALNPMWESGFFQSGFTDALSVLNEAGSSFHKLRTNGLAIENDNQHRLINDERKAKSDLQFYDDNRKFAAALKEDTGVAPARVAFGLPHNYFRPPGKARLNWNIPANGIVPARRASPAILHIHQLPDRSFAIIWTLAYAKFLEQDKLPTSRGVVTFDQDTMQKTLSKIFSASTLRSNLKWIAHTKSTNPHRVPSL